MLFFQGNDQLWDLVNDQNNDCLSFFLQIGNVLGDLSEIIKDFEVIHEFHVSNKNLVGLGGCSYLDCRDNSFPVNIFEIDVFVIVLNHINFTGHILLHLLANSLCNWMLTCFFSEVDHFKQESVVRLGSCQLKLLTAVDEVFNLWFS